MTTKQIEKLKKQLLLEELRRRKKKSNPHRLLIASTLLLIALLGGFFWYRANMDGIVEKRFQKALALRDSGDLAGAADLLGKLLTQHPDSALAPELFLEEGRLLHLSLGRYQEALLAYLSLERDYPDSPQAASARQLIAELYKYGLDDQLQAISAYQKLLDTSVENGDRIQYELADSCFRLNNFEQARIEFENLLSSYPASPLAPEVQFRIAVTYALEGSADSAMQSYRAVTARWPSSPYAIEARFGLATVLEERERLREALAILEALKGNYPNPGALDQRIDHVRERINTKHASK